MSNIFIILPTQLFDNIDLLKKYDKIFLIEEPYYINTYYHKQKLLLHISSMYYYYDYLKNNKINVEYITYDKINYSKILVNKNVIMYNPIDKKMIKLFNKYKVKYLDTKIFLNSNEELLKFKKDNNKYSQSEFYKNQRIKFNILVDKNNKPLYGKWSFDNENRNKFDKSYKESKLIFYNNSYIKEAKEYINKNFLKSFGEFADDGSYYPCTHNDAKKHLKKFINERLIHFGKNQDAISHNVIYGEHSNISALLNIGLLTPMYVIQEILKYFNSSKNKKELINSVEGIIRQIIGWREYMHFIYLRYGEMIMTKFNKLKLINTIPKSWYHTDNKTELEIINNIINKVYKYAYLHHIERLMVVNNIMILYEFKLKDIYKWFMTCFIDSYNWVMIPNILMNINSIDSNIKYMTKMYISSDNYIRKMSNYNNKEDFQIINNLYWNFLKKYKNILKHDYGLSRQLHRI
jgi:deoxyribodipyrimidine photolyase-related protein